MPSQVWGRDPQEAFEEPYEYAVEDQFAREARTLFRQPGVVRLRSPQDRQAQRLV
jgi:hypothetical protein